MSKKQKCPEFENHERWLVSFADMMTLLFALFVVLFALKEGAESPDIEQAVGSITETFNLVLEDIPVNRRIGPTEAGFGIFEHFHGDSVRPPLTAKPFPSSKESLRIIDGEMKKVEMVLQDRLYGKDAFRDSQRPGQERVISVHRDQDGFRVRLLASHFFESGSYHMKDSAKKQLAPIANVLKELGRNITIQGHTDSQPAKGALGNWEISALRAAEVARYFIYQQGFPSSTLSIAGYADTRPIADNSSNAGRQLNRRIEIKVHYDE